MLCEIFHLEFSFFDVNDLLVCHEIKLEVLFVIDLEILLNLKLEVTGVLELVAAGVLGNCCRLETGYLRDGSRLVTGTSSNKVACRDVVCVELRSIYFLSCNVLVGIEILVKILLVDLVSFNTGGVTTSHVISTKLSGGILMGTSKCLTSTERVARVVASSLVLLIKLDFPIIFHEGWLADLYVFDFLNVFLRAIVTLAAVLFLEFKFGTSNRFWRCFSAQNTLKVSSDLSHLLIDDHSWLLNDIHDGG